tara:strand:+ start:1098 stop:1223 length:126 start_codon:yes stop_codon:yes gene_type:complete
MLMKGSTSGPIVELPITEIPGRKLDEIPPSNIRMKNPGIKP